MTTTVKTKDKGKAPAVPDHISNSQIETGACLYKYAKVRLQKEVEVTNPAIIAGRFVHEVIHRYTAECLKLKTDADFEAMSAIIESVAKATNVPDDIKAKSR